MLGCSRVRGKIFAAQCPKILIGKGFPPLPGPLLHKSVEEREKSKLQIC
jgi:hypothetical protein